MLIWLWVLLYSGIKNVGWKHIFILIIGTYYFSYEDISSPKGRIEFKMFFKDEKDFSLLPKCLFMTSIIIASFLVGYLMFKNVNELIPWLKPYAINGDYIRRVVLLFCLFFYVSRLFVTVFVFLKRKMAWSEMLIVSGLMSFALFSFAKVGGSSNQPVGILDYFSILLYLFG